VANTKTAKENILINARNNARNKHYKTKMKSSIKSALSAIESKAEERQTVVLGTLKTIDKVASKGIIKKTTAARKKSNLHKALNKSLA
jgi:small subunit ribosomal protein S20